MSEKPDPVALKKTIEGMSAGEKRLLLALGEDEGAEAEALLSSGGFNQLVEVMNAASWLESKGMVRVESAKEVSYTLARKSLAGRDLPERRALRFLAGRDGICTMDELASGAKLGKADVPIAVGWLRKKGWATIRKEDGETVLEMTGKGAAAAGAPGRDEDMIGRLAAGEVQARDLDELDSAALEQLRSRKEIVREIERVRRTIRLTGTGKAALAAGIKLRMEVSQLTPELVQSGKWRNADFRRYDVGTFAPTASGGREHPLTVITERIREIFVSMGFSEITGDYVESGFWNMDALFIPQDHPARDLQDTLFMSEPASFDLSAEREDGTLEKIRAVHESGGGTGSTGWGYEWSSKKAARALLRTHTTVNTIRHLAARGELPIRVFSLEKCFRKEALDSTHLPEFHQIEGIAAEEGASFDMLVGLLCEFYARMGFPQIRVRGGYFPYTEPSLEVEAMMDGRWVELGGAGIFRPEVTAPFGHGEPVMAWGLGLERLAMLTLGLSDIRDLYLSDLDWLRGGPVP